MPNPTFTIADVVDRGLFHPAAAKAVTVEESSELDSAATVAAFRKAASRATVGKQFAGLAGAVLKFKNPLELATGFINAKHQALGGNAGFLGAPTTPVTVCPDGKGYFRHFKGGSIYWHPWAGAHEVHGLIRAKWAKLGWERSFLGYPTTDETKGRELESRGRYNHFQGGSIYWHPDTGAFEVHGAIRVKYLELGAENSFLGYPTTDETTTPDGIGRFNHFQAGSIYWTPYTWAHEVHGLIRQFWAQHGWERNAALGYPITDELIPNRTIGHIRPQFTRKPLRGVALDVIRLPEEATTPGLAVSPGMAVSPTGVDITPSPRMTISPMIATTSLSRTTTIAAPSTSPPSSARVNPILSEVRIRPELVAAIAATGVSEGAKEGGESRNRFGDFENGVLFWKRGANAAIQLRPWRQTAVGDKMFLSAAEVVAVASAPVRNALSHVTGAQVANLSFAGTTRYWFDGATTHNRRHKINVLLQGMHISGIIPQPLLAIVEVHVEVSYDPMIHKVVGYLTEWRLLSASGNFPGGPIQRQLHALLDQALWARFPVLTIPSQAGAPLPVLSVKTTPDGDVDIYVEP
jgi:hypothetical protein